MPSIILIIICILLTLYFGGIFILMLINKKKKCMNLLKIASCIVNSIQGTGLLIPIVTIITMYTYSRSSNNTNTKENVAESNLAVSLVFLGLWIYNLTLNLIFLLIYQNLFDDPNPFSDSMFRTKLKDTKDMKILGKLLVLMGHLSSQNSENLLLINLIVVALMTYVVYRNSVTLDFLSLTIQIFVSCVDAIILVISVFTVIEQLNRNDAAIHFTIINFILSCVAAFIFSLTSKKRLISNLLTSGGGKIGIDEIFKEIVNIFIMIRQHKFTERPVLNFNIRYIEKEIGIKLSKWKLENLSDHNLGNPSQVSIYVREESHSGDDALLEKTKTKYDGAITHGVKDKLYNRIIICLENIVLMKPQDNEIRLFLIFIIAYSSCQGNVACKHIAYIHSNIGRNYEVKTYFALYVLCIKIQKKLHSEKRKCVEYVKSDFEAYAESDKLFAKLRSLIMSNNKLFEFFWKNLMVNPRKFEFFIQMYNKIHTKHKRIKKLYAKLRELPRFKGRIAKMYKIYLKYTLNDKKAAMRIYVTLNESTLQLRCGLNQQNAIKNMINPSTDKHFIEISISRENMGAIFYVSSGFDNYCGWSTSILLNSNLKDFMIPENWIFLVENIRKILGQGEDRDIEVEDDNLILILDVEGYVRINYYKIFIGIDTNGNTKATLMLWPMNHKDLLQPMLFVYDRSNTKLRYLTKNAGEYSGITIKDIEKERIDFSDKYSIYNIWPELLNQDSFQKFNGRKALKSTMKCNLKYNNMDYTEGSLNARENYISLQNESVISKKVVWIQSQNIKSVEGCNLGLIKATLIKNQTIDKLKETNKNNSLNSSNVQSTNTSIQYFEDNENRIQKLTNILKENTEPFYIKFLLTITCIFLISFCLCYAYGMLLSTRINKDYETKAEFIEVITDKIEKITSISYATLNIELNNRLQSDSFSNILSRSISDTIIDNFYSEIIRKQTIYESSLLSQNTHITLDSFFSNAFNEKENLIMDELGIEINIEFNPNLYASSQLYNALFYLIESVDNFLLNQDNGLYKRIERVSEELVKILLDVYENHFKDLTVFIEDKWKQLFYLTALFYSLFILSLVVTMIIYAHSLLSIFKCLGMLHTLHPRHVSNLLSLIKRNENIRNGNAVNMEENLLLETNILYNTLREQTGANYELNNTDGDELVLPPAKIAKKYILISLRKTIVFFIVTLTLSILVPIFHINLLNRPVRATSTRFSLLQSLFDLKINLSRAKFNYLKFHFDEDCKSACEEITQTINKEIRRSLDTFTFLLPSLNTNASENLYLHLEAAENNYCSFLDGDFSYLSDFCNTRNRTHMRMSSIIIRLMFNYEQLKGNNDMFEVYSSLSHNSDQIYFLEQSISKILQEALSEQKHYLNNRTKFHRIIFGVIIFTFVSITITFFLTVKTTLKNEISKTRLFLNILNSGNIDINAYMEQVLNKFKV